MKRYAILVGLMLLVLSFAAGCGNGEKDKGGKDTDNKDKIQIVTTIFPEFDWVREIVGDAADHVEITMLLDSGTDLHSYQPTAKDIMKLSTCDLFIYVGGESDEWVEDALKEGVNKDRKVICLLDELGDGVKEEEIVEGMEAEEEEDEEDGEEEEPEIDEHVWLSLRNAEVFCKAIENALCEIDAANSAAYKANAEAYVKKLEALDASYKEKIGAGSTKTLLFADRFPFRYLVEDYGLRYYAAFVGCSAETEASFETILFLSGKVDELGLKSVMTLEKSDGKIAKTVIENTKDKTQQILAVNSLQSVTAKDVAGGVTYLSVMEQNLSVIEEALK